MRRTNRNQDAHAPVLRLYLRRSKGDEGHQQYSLDVQREGCRRFAQEELPRRGVAMDWFSRVEYVDDDRAGDDFLGRGELRRLRDDVKRGDVILCRDQSRLGRDALEVTLAIRDLVKDRGGRLLYYANAQEVEFASAIDAAMAFIAGTGHQMELEAIRSRTREALRSRVRAGRIAGGRCYGYALQRHHDVSGRPYTVAVIDPVQAEIVRRIFRELLAGKGLKRIVAGLNADGIPSPRAGKRGTGSWSTGCVHVMLRNPRYHGLYRHGRFNRVRQGGRRLTVAAPETDVIVVEVPDWKIVDDDTWFAVQERLGERQRTVPQGRVSHPLSGLARCGVCGGAIGITNGRSGQSTVRAYGCMWHNNRGASVCSVTLRQPADELEGWIVDAIVDDVLTPAVAEQMKQNARSEIERQVAASARDCSQAQRELEKLRAEQRNVSRAIATSGDEIPELVVELKRRSERIRLLEADIAVASRTGEGVRALVEESEAAIQAKLDDLRSALRASDRAVRRELFHELFPEGLVMTPTDGPGMRAGKPRKVFGVTGTARICAVDKATPTGPVQL